MNAPEEHLRHFMGHKATRLELHEYPPVRIVGLTGGPLFESLGGLAVSLARLSSTRKVRSQGDSSKVIDLVPALAFMM